MNSAAVNTGVRVSFRIRVFYTPRPKLCLCPASAPSCLSKSVVLHPYHMLMPGTWDSFLTAPTPNIQSVTSSLKPTSKMYHELSPSPLRPCTSLTWITASDLQLCPFLSQSICHTKGRGVFEKCKSYCLSPYSFSLNYRFTESCKEHTGRCHTSFSQLPLM